VYGLRVGGLPGDDNVAVKSVRIRRSEDGHKWTDLQNANGQTVKLLFFFKYSLKKLEFEEDTRGVFYFFTFLLF